ncbi:MAG: pyridoxal-phosphate dependent enzyme, partial [bacterium]
MSSDLPDVTVNPFWTGYRCSVCGAEYPVEWSQFVCAACGVDGILSAVFDYEAIAGALDRRDPFPVRGRADLWRFAPLLPVVPAAGHPAWSVGDTPLLAPDRLRSKLTLPSLYLKDDTCLPSASLKDRAAALAIADATRLGRDHLACASTGNAAASLAVLGARAGLASTIYVPEAAPRAKLAQLLLHGSEVVRVAGTYDQAFDLSLQALAEHGWYSRNCAHNPLLVEGKKTAGLEIALALGWQVPDAIFVPVGDGCIISSVGKAFSELHAVGLIACEPRLYGVQAAGSAPLAAAWKRLVDKEGIGGPPALNGREILAACEAVVPRTVADSIAVGVPRNRVKAWQAVARSGGAFLAVDDDAILSAVGDLAREA